MAGQLTTPRELLAAYLRQMFWIERELADNVLPRLSEQAHAPDLRAGFDRHLLETEAHVETRARCSTISTFPPSRRRARGSAASWQSTSNSSAVLWKAIIS